MAGYSFDDGPYINTRKLVDLLDENGAKGYAYFSQLPTQTKLNP